MTMRATMSRLAVAFVVALVGAGLAAIASQVDRPQRPSLIFPPRFVGAHEALIVQVRIEPHPRIETVLAEAWEICIDTDDPDGTGPNTIAEDRCAYRRGSWWWAERGKRIYIFEWRTGLDRGRYALVGKILIGRGITLESAPSTLVVY